MECQPLVEMVLQLQGWTLLLKTFDQPFFGHREDTPQASLSEVRELWNAEFQ